MTNTLNKARKAAEDTAKQLRDIAESEATKQLGPVIAHLRSDSEQDLIVQVLEIANEQLIDGEPFTDKETLLDRVLMHLTESVKILAVRRAALPAEKRTRAQEQAYVNFTRMINWLKLSQRADITRGGRQRDQSDPDKFRSGNVLGHEQFVLVIHEQHGRAKFETGRDRSSFDWLIDEALTIDEDSDLAVPVCIADLDSGTVTPLKLTVIDGEPITL